VDVPTRESCALAVVAPKKGGAAFAPMFAGLLFAHPGTISVPCICRRSPDRARGVLLYRAFVHLPPRE
jgi:hypothetical protein